LIHHSNVHSLILTMQIFYKASQYIGYITFNLANTLLIQISCGSQNRPRLIFLSFLPLPKVLLKTFYFSVCLLLYLPLVFQSSRKPSFFQVYQNSSLNKSIYLHFSWKSIYGWEKITVLISTDTKRFVLRHLSKW